MARPIQRELVESEEYLDQLEKFGAEEVDRALEAIMWSLAVRAEEWPTVRGYRRLRVAKTDRTETTLGIRVWFEIRDSHHVDLLFLEWDDED